MKNSSFGSRHVGLTMSVSSDGTGAPCTHADTKDSKWKNGSEAETREVKLFTVAFYDRVDKKDHSIVHRDNVLGFGSTANSSDFISEVNGIIGKMGYDRVQRVQFISDGAAWIENLWMQVFSGADGNGKVVIRTIDIYHVAEYLSTIVKAYYTVKISNRCLTYLTKTNPIQVGIFQHRGALYKPKPNML